MYASSSADLGLVTLLATCGDDGIYGGWKNTASGAVIQIEEKNMKLPGVSHVVEKWDVSKAQKTYVAHTACITLNIEKTKKWSSYYG